MPAIYPFRAFATSGGLMSYGNAPIDDHRCPAGYVDRILRGERAGDLPVNLKAAALGLTLPPALPLRADEVIA